MSTYVYTPLELERNQIRLVMLMPRLSSADRGIEIQIFNTDADAAPDYEALSYAWGAPDRTANEVLISRGAPDNQPDSLFGASSHHQTGRRLGITRNLWTALKYLRLSHETRVLWIDSICINQDDMEERSREVVKMGRIYRQARRVVVWLGEESPDTSLAIDTLNSIGGSITRSIDKDGTTIHWPRPGTYASLLQRDPRAERAKVLSWIAIRSLLGATWFTRLWTFQEILLASNAIFVIGFQTIDLHLFSKAMDWINRHRDDKITSMINTVMDRKSTNTVKRTMSYSLRRDRGSSLRRLLVDTQQLHCEDPRDRVYALLGLLDPEESANIIPDYTKSIEQVYLEAFLNNLTTSTKLLLLQICDSADSNSTLALPSWVPNLSIPRLAPIAPWAASGSSAAFYRYHASSKSLQISGKFVCSIKQVASPIPVSAELPEILAVCHTWEPGVGPKKAYVVSSYRLIDAFISTLFLGSLKNIAELKVRRGFYNADAMAVTYDCLIVNGDMSDKTPGYCKRNLVDKMPGRAFFTTAEGYVGLCPKSARPGDKILIALGASNPLLVRPVSEEGNRYQACGECFVLGLMDGEGILGLLPRGWAITTESVIEGTRVDGMRRVFRTPDKKLTQLDPRAGPVRPSVEGLLWK